LGQKAKTPRLTGNRGVLKILFLNQKFVSTMPKRQPTRVQMDIYPLDCACFSVGANVVFIFNGGEETPFRGVCQIDLCDGNFGNPQITPIGADFNFIGENPCNLRINKSLSDFRAVLDCFEA
jgi:hypothetical protein